MASRICPRCHRTYDGGEASCTYDGEPLVEGRRIDLVRVGKTRHIGAILGNRFQIRGFIAHGGTSRLYLAEDVHTQEPVALKVLEPPWSLDRVARERFLQEAEAASRIDHPGVARILFVGQRGDGTPYLAMEYLFGESLAESLERVRVMDFDIGLPVLRELTHTLEAAHACGVIHRDVKPENVVLLGEKGEPYGVKLVDFGFAKLRDSTITAAGTAIGSVDYMAPEQCVTDTVDERTDVYGLGVIAYRMFSGQLPFGEAPTAELLALHLIAPAKPLSELAGIDDAVSAVVDKCMRKDPAQRYPNMRALRADLDALASGVEPMAAQEEPTGDLYTPQGLFSKLVARALYRKLSVPLPTTF